MEALFGTYDVKLRDVKVGTLSVSADGLRTRFDCHCAACAGEGVLRLCCLSGGKTVSLGIPEPAGGGLRLTRLLTRAELRSLGLGSIGACRLTPADAPAAPEAPADDPAPPAQAVLPGRPPEPDSGEAPWLPLQDAVPWLRDSALAASCARCPGLLTRADGGDLLLAVPLSPDIPFPLMPVFRTGAPAVIGGRSCMVFRVRDGEIL